MWNVYDKNKTYYDEQGQEITYDRMKREYPVVDAETIMINTSGVTILDKCTMSVAQSRYRLMNEDDPEVLAKKMTKKDEKEKTESSPLERIASSLDYIVLYLLRKGI